MTCWCQSLVPMVNATLGSAASAGFRGWLKGAGRASPAEAGRIWPGWES